ncbi:MAG: cyclophilin-like fold protein, partial [Coriobacteriaceae bacterium]|nr:cyclophilin-like fold protein [Coriobacteriaceae bacterium]
QAASSSGSDAPALAIGGNTDASGAGEVSMESKRIVIVFENQEFSATLADTEAAREFAALLPLRLQMEELNGNENPLPTDSRNPETIHAGDLMLFGSSCIVLFYETFPTQYTYTPIARLDDAEGLAEVVGSGDIEARIEFE